MNNETDVLEAPTITDMAIVQLNITDAEIARMKSEYMTLHVNGIEDKAGLKRVYESRQIVKKTRTSLVKYADELKEKALAWQRKVNAEKNRVVSELESIEAHLQAEEDKIQKEKYRIAAEQEKAAQAALQQRVDKLAEYGYRVELVLLKSLTDAQFESTLANAKVEYEEELALQAEQKRLAELEAKRLEDERKELEALRKKQAEAQAIIDKENERIRKEQEEKEAAIKAEQEKIENEKRELERKRLQEEDTKKLQLKIEELRKEAAENERLRLIAEEQENKRLAEEKLAQSSDKTKFKNVIVQLQAIAIPEMKSQKAKSLSYNITGGIKTLIEQIKNGL